MYINGYEVIAPTIFNQTIEESQVFGALATIWLQSDHHRNAPLYRFAERAIPILHSRQFALFIKNKQPVAYVSWAYFDEECEQRYLKDDDVLKVEKNWCSGNRGWIIDWFALNHISQEISTLVRRNILPDSIFSFLYHKSTKNNPRRLFFRGVNVSKLEFQQFIDAVSS